MSVMERAYSTDLKANTNMMQLSEAMLTSTENKVAFARQGYNGPSHRVATTYKGRP